MAIFNSYVTNHQRVLLNDHTSNPLKFHTPLVTYPIRAEHPMKSTQTSAWKYPIGYIIQSSNCISIYIYIYIYISKYAFANTNKIHI